MDTLTDTSPFIAFPSDKQTYVSNCCL